MSNKYETGPFMSPGYGVPGPHQYPFRLPKSGESILAWHEGTETWKSHARGRVSLATLWKYPEPHEAPDTLLREMSTAYKAIHCNDGASLQGHCKTDCDSDDPRLLGPYAETASE